MREEGDDPGTKGPLGLRRVDTLHLLAGPARIEHVRSVPRARAHILIRVHIEGLHPHGGCHIEGHIEVRRDPKHRQHHLSTC